jgi:hypothetical protein
MNGWIPFAEGLPAPGQQVHLLTLRGEEWAAQSEASEKGLRFLVDAGFGRVFRYGTGNFQGWRTA